MTLRRQFTFWFTCKILLVICSINYAQTQTTVQWSDPIPVSGENEGTDSPRIALGPDGKPIVLFGKGGVNATIRFTHWANNAFADSKLISTNGINPGIYDFGGLDLAIHGDTIYIAGEKSNFGIFHIRSTDLGANFELPVLAFPIGSAHIVTLPSIAVDANGNPMISYLYESANESNAIYQLSRSTDGGLSFLAPINASAPADGDYVCECCPSDIISAGDSVWLAFRSLRTGNVRDVWVSASGDQGATFTNAFDVDRTDWVQTICPSSGPRMQLTKDSLVVVWMSRGTGTIRVHGSVTAKNSGITGSSFTFDITGPFGTQNHPDIAGNADTLGVVWEETGVPGTGTDIFFAFSVQGASGLPLQVNNLTEISGTQKAPALAYRNGVFHLVYTDTQTGRIWYRRGVVTAASPTHAHEAPETFRIFPNPATDYIQIEPGDFDQFSSFSIQLTDPLGRVCRSWENVLPGQKLALSGISSGLYTLRLDDNFRISTQKVLVRHP